MCALFLGCRFTAVELSDWIRSPRSRNAVCQGCLGDRLQAPHPLPFKFSVDATVLAVLRRVLPRLITEQEEHSGYFPLSSRVRMSGAVSSTLVVQLPEQGSGSVTLHVAPGSQVRTEAFCREL